MREILLIGNPNVGKSTLFNRLTKSSEHTGNFHGVTVEESSKVVKSRFGEYNFVDLPGIYSLSVFSNEEKVSFDKIISNNVERIVIVDANAIRRNLYLALELNELKLDYKLLINNYNYFSKNKNKLDVELLTKKLGVECKIVNAKKVKFSDFEQDFLNENSDKYSDNAKSNENKKLKNFLKIDQKMQNFQKNIEKNNKKFEKNENFNNLNKNNYIFDASKFFQITNKNEDENIKNKSYESNKNDIKYLKTYLEIVKSKTSLDEFTIIKAFNGIYENISSEDKKIIEDLIPDIIKARYDYIDNLLKDVLTLQENYVYGVSKFDKVLLNPAVMSIGFILTFFLSIYLIFFLVGPWLSDLFIALVNLIIVNPFMNFLYSVTDNIWLIEFFNGGVFSSVITVLSFLPQVVLLYVFLTILEDSGLIARMCFVFDDFLSKLGLNGKSIYIILLGLGCNTMATTATKNLNGKNLRIKSAILNPYISCMARLPIFVIIATAFFGVRAYFVVVGLYLLGLVVALVFAKILNKTILPTEAGELLLEFPPLRHIDVSHVVTAVKTNTIDFAKRIFGVVISVGIIIWILTHTATNFVFTQDITNSILYLISSKISFIFAPIGLNSPAIICALVVGVMAKELIVSIFSISNATSTVPELILSLTVSLSVINFTTASAMSFLVFTLLYAPCMSTIVVIKKECGTFMMWFSLISSFVIAYMLSFIVYTFLTYGILRLVLTLIVITLVLVSIIFLIKRIKNKKCLFCSKRCIKR